MKNNDFDVMTGLSYKELQDIYNENFDLGYTCKTIEDKFALIGLICYITDKLKKQKPDVTHWQIIKKIGDEYSLPTRFMMGLAIMCESFAYGCTTFPLFGVAEKDALPKIKEYFKNYLPF